MGADYSDHWTTSLWVTLRELLASSLLERSGGDQQTDLLHPDVSRTRRLAVV